MRRAVATTLVLLIVGACSSEAPAGGAAGRRSDATSAEAPAVRLTADLAPRLLLAGVAVPVPFSLLAAGIRCADDDNDGGAGHGDCLLVEAVLGGAACAHLHAADAAAHSCGEGSAARNDLSTVQDCGVLKETLVAGRGDVPGRGARVTAHYVGTLADGQVFDSSRERGEPFTFTLGAHAVILCWELAVASMRVGERATVTCAPAYAYGEEGAGGGLIPGGATLTFDIELLHFEGGTRPAETCGRVVGSARVAVSTLTDVESEVVVLVDDPGLLDLRLLVTHTAPAPAAGGGGGAVGGEVLAAVELRGVRVVPAFLCLLPAVVIVLMAVGTKNVVLALMGGLIVGGTLLEGYNPVLGFMRAGDTFLYGALQKADQGLLLFTWFIYVCRCICVYVCVYRYLQREREIARAPFRHPS